MADGLILWPPCDGEFFSGSNGKNTLHGTAQQSTSHCPQATRLAAASKLVELNVDQTKCFQSRGLATTIASRCERATPLSPRATHAGLSDPISLLNVVCKQVFIDASHMSRDCYGSILLFKACELCLNHLATLIAFWLGVVGKLFSANNSERRFNVEKIHPRLTKSLQRLEIVLKF